MTETGTETGKRPPSLWWLAVAAVVFLFGLVPFGWVVANTVQGIADYDVHDFGTSGSTSLDIDDDQVAVFSTYTGPGAVRCSGEGPGAGGPLDHPSTSLNLTIGSIEWNRVAVTPDDWAGGTYVVTCNVVSPGAGNPKPLLGYADNPSIMSTVVGFAVATGVAILAGVIALTIALVVLVKRHNANRLRRYPEFPSSPPTSR
ncbi:MAG: hypothetical protein ACRDO7_16635 [Nocardioidaceae bacterium]